MVLDFLVHVWAALGFVVSMCALTWAISKVYDFIVDWQADLCYRRQVCDAFWLGYNDRALYDAATPGTGRIHNPWAGDFSRERAYAGGWNSYNALRDIHIHAKLD